MSIIFLIMGIRNLQCWEHAVWVNFKERTNAHWSNCQFLSLWFYEQETVKSVVIFLSPLVKIKLNNWYHGRMTLNRNFVTELRKYAGIIKIQSFSADKTWAYLISKSFFGRGDWGRGTYLQEVGGAYLWSPIWIYPEEYTYQFRVCWVFFKFIVIIVIFFLEKLKRYFW